MLRQVRGVVADPGEQGRSTRPLPTSTDEVQVRDGRNPALVDEVAVRVLGLGNLNPIGIVFLTGRPEHRIHFARLPIGEGDSLPFRLNHTSHDVHTLSLQPLELQGFAREGIGLHKVASDRTFARGSQDAQLVHPPEDAPPQYPVWAHPPVMSGGKENLVRTV